MDKYQRIILEKLINENSYGAKHLQETTILKSIKRSERGQLKEALKQLVRQQIVIKFPHKPEASYHLNSGKIKEIKKLLEQ